MSRVVLHKAPPGSADVRRPGVQLEDVISRVLQVGVWLSALVIALGVLLWAVAARCRGWPGPSPQAAGGAHWRGLGVGPLAVVQAGLWLLVLTPVIRVATSILVFLRDRDWAYVGIASLVLLFIVASFLVGRG